MIRGYNAFRALECHSRNFSKRWFSKARKQKVVHKTPQQIRQEEDKKRKGAEEKKMAAKQELERERQEYEESLRKFVPDGHYQNIPFKASDPRRLFSEDEIRQAVEAIDNDDESDFQSHPYRIFVAMLLERPPVVKPKYEYAEHYRRCLTDLKLNQHNMPNLVKELYSEKINLSRKQHEENLGHTPIITQDDEMGNYQSLNRCLQERLYFICKRKGQKFYEFPWTERMKDETLNDTARRALYSRTRNGNIRFFATGLGPCGHNQVEYPAKEQEKWGKKGAQVFFQRCYWVSGNAREYEMPADVEESLWVTKSELEDRINPTLWKSVNELIMD